MGVSGNPLAFKAILEGRTPACPGVDSRVPLRSPDSIFHRKFPRSVAPWGLTSDQKGSGETPSRCHELCVPLWQPTFCLHPPGSGSGLHFPPGHDVQGEICTVITGGMAGWMETLKITRVHTHAPTLICTLTHTHTQSHTHTHTHTSLTALTTL
jgi:hypothetical protein